MLLLQYNVKVVSNSMSRCKIRNKVLSHLSLRWGCEQYNRDKDTYLYKKQ